jgi:hypothetical protein
MEMRASIFYVGIAFFAVLYGSMIVSFVIKKIQGYRKPGIKKTKEFRKWERNRKIKSKFTVAMFAITLLLPAMLAYILLDQQGVLENINTLVMLAIVIITGYFWLRFERKKTQAQTLKTYIEQQYGKTNRNIR